MLLCWLACAGPEPERFGAHRADADADSDSDAGVFQDTGWKLEVDLVPDLDHGRVVYEVTCMEGCHDRVGRLEDRVPALTDAQLHLRIEGGVGKMPPIDELDHQDVVDVIAYLRVAYPE